MVSYDTVIRNATIATAVDVFLGDIALCGETIAALGRDLPPGSQEIDGAGKILTPGGVDSHCHIEQLAASGLMNADTFETATRSALAGGTTTVIPFAAQHVGMNLRQVVDEYHALAQNGAMADYAFHMILTDPTAEVLQEQLPALVREGHSSLKCFLTYDRLRLDDLAFLDVLMAAREHGCMVCVHAENHGMLSWMGKRLVDRGYTDPPFHAVSHPRLAEAEAINRAISMAALVDQPLMIFHISTAEGVDVVRQWQARGQKVYGETCTQYLVMTKEDLDQPGIDGAKWICSPPLRDSSDHGALWNGLRNGVLSTISSDHAPYRMDKSGKLAKGAKPSFKEIANGMGGLQMRLPVLFDAMGCFDGRALSEFVRLTATEPARIYNLHPRKGSIAIGGDADLVMWDPKGRMRVQHDTVIDNSGYTAFEGRELRGRIKKVWRRGACVFDDGQLRAQAGSGCFLPRSGGEAAMASGTLSPEFDPLRNFGAELY